MTRIANITEPKDFRSLIVRCDCGTSTTLALASDIRIILTCQGCNKQLDLKAAYPLLAGIKQAQSGDFKGFKIEFEMAEGPA